MDRPSSFAISARVLCSVFPIRTLSVAVGINSNVAYSYYIFVFWFIALRRELAETGHLFAPSTHILQAQVRPKLAGGVRLKALHKFQLELCRAYGFLRRRHQALALAGPGLTAQLDAQ